MRKALLSLLCFVISLFSVAQPESGKVYNLKNVGKGNSLGITSLFKVIAVTTNKDDLSQQWYVESVSGSTFTLRNLASGFYLQGNNSASGAWTLVPAKVDLEYTNDSGAFAIRQSDHTDTYNYLHIDGSGNAVSWTYSENNNTLWQFEEVSYAKEEIDEVLNSVNNLVVSDEKVATYQTALDALFPDKACTQLKVS